MRTALAITIVAATRLVTACAVTDPVVDDLADETASDGEDGKADAASTFTYYMVMPDMRLCQVGEPCGGFFVARTNRSTTRCGNGSSLALCYVDRISWDGTGMPASLAKSFQQRLRDGENILIRGSIASVQLLEPSAHQGAQLAATEIWEPGSVDADVSGTFVKIRDNVGTCGSSCTMTETRLNSSRQADLSTVDLMHAGAADDMFERGLDAIHDGADGLIVVGSRYKTASGLTGRRANQFYIRAPIPARGDAGTCAPGAAC